MWPCAAQHSLSSLLARFSGLTLGENELNFFDFNLFKNCLIYVGKGINSRKDIHLKEAKELYLGLIPYNKATKGSL